jgi:pre-rRNA-processing protein TSR2
MSLSLWPALTLAVQNSWGGPDSSDKRDWFAGAISELFVSRPDTDIQDVEEMLLQVMNDEFEVNVDDGSAEEVAARIVGLRKLTLQGDFVEVDRMYEQWVERQKKGGSDVKFQKVERREEDDDTDWDSDDMEDDDDEAEDVDMDEAPALAKAPREKGEPQVDEDGFTTVVAKKKR